MKLGQILILVYHFAVINVPAIYMMSFQVITVNYSFAVNNLYVVVAVRRNY